MGIQTLLYYYGYFEKLRKAQFLFLLISRIGSRPVLIQLYFRANLTPTHSQDHFIPVIPRIISFPVYGKARRPYRFLQLGPGNHRHSCDWYSLY
jgi:hypothetical protein